MTTGILFSTVAFNDMPYATADAAHMVSHAKDKKEE